MAPKHDRVVLADGMGSPASAEVLFDEHWLTAWRAAYVVAGRRDIADDAAQDAFIKAARSLSSFDRDKPFAPWIAKIAVNRARDLLRAERRRGFASLDEESEAPQRTDVSEVLLAVASLPREQREAVVLHHVLGFSLKEVAEIVGAPEGTVSSRIGRGVASIRQTVEA
jgi:RNA polymerase sigma-70 factor (ECF subfamily)